MAESRDQKPPTPTDKPVATLDAKTPASSPQSQNFLDSIKTKFQHLAGSIHLALTSKNSSTNASSTSPAPTTSTQPDDSADSSLQTPQTTIPTKTFFQKIKDFVTPLFTTNTYPIQKFIASSYFLYDTQNDPAAQKQQQEFQQTFPKLSVQAKTDAINNALQDMAQNHPDAMLHKENLELYQKQKNNEVAMFPVSPLPYDYKYSQKQQADIATQSTQNENKHFQETVVPNFQKRQQVILDRMTQFLQPTECLLPVSNTATSTDDLPTAHVKVITIDPTKPISEQIAAQSSLNLSPADKETYTTNATNRLAQSYAKQLNSTSEAKNITGWSSLDPSLQSAIVKTVQTAQVQ